MFRSIARGAANSVVILGLTVMAMGSLGTLAGIRVNSTPSIPLGFYSLVDKPVEKGDYVIFCPPQQSVFDLAKDRGYIAAGFCEGNYNQLMKRVVGVPGDAVRVLDDGVRVNNKALSDSARKEVDPGGRPMPVYRWEARLAKGQYWLMGESDISFDARYFGPIQADLIEGVIRPLLTWSP